MDGWTPGKNIVTNAFKGEGKGWGGCYSMCMYGNAQSVFTSESLDEFVET